jgi:pimeloyl-ACP methyl ester carboxylesterase
VLLLHGFPQEPLTFKLLAESLAQAGYQAIAPWLRGYAASNRSEPYIFTQFQNDVLGISDALALQQIDVVGVGIGGALAWMLAAYNPNRVRSITSLLFPHPAALAHALAQDPEQKKKWQTLEDALGAGEPDQQAARLLAQRAAGLRRLLADARLQDTYINRYVSRMCSRGALAAALAWHRAIDLEEFAWVPSVSVPAQILWSEGPGLSWGAIDGSREYMRALFVSQRIPYAGHFMVETAPAAVTRSLLWWLKGLRDSTVPHQV